MSEAILTDVRGKHVFDECALSEYLIEHIEGFQGPLSVKQFDGGQSNPTFLLSTPAAQYVLRKQPPGKLLPSAHQVDREYRVMKALQHSAVPVPQMLCLCQDPSVMGCDFYVMSYVPGRLFADASLPGVSATDRKALYLELARILADLHRINPADVGLEDYGKTGNYFSRQIARWTRQYEAVATETLPDMERLAKWLPENTPDTERSRIVHGDFRIGNCLLNPHQPQIDAVIDWELSTLGDPLADVGYVCQTYYITSFEFGLGDKPLQQLGIPTQQEFVEAYCQRAEIDSLQHLEFSIIYNLYRIAGISQGVYKRGLEGNASSSMALQFKNVARAYSDIAWKMVESL